MRSFSIICVLLLLTSCARKTYEKVYPTLNDGRYDSEFPYRNCSEQLDEISRAVKKIFCLNDYKTYILKDSNRFLPADLGGLSDERLMALSGAVTTTFEASNGSATIIYYKDNRIALLTCWHILDFPDTLYTYMDDNDPTTVDHLHSISVKFRQRLFFTSHPEGKDLKVIAKDEENDLALLGRETAGYNEDLVTFKYPIGTSSELEWGTFVYIMGYPLGYQMITRGIVSKPTGPRNDYFLVDASFNEGFSGGIILAIKDGIPNFELVGIGRSASATYESILVPEKKDYEMIYNPQIPYEGDVFVELKKTLNYGVTRAIPSETVRKFIKKNRSDLEKKGYDLSHYY